MIELSREGFEKARSLFAHVVPHAPMLFSVFDGKSPGRVFVDCAERPVSCAVLTNQIWAVCNDGASQEFLNHFVEETRRHSDITLVWPEQSRHGLIIPPQPTRHVERLEFLSRIPCAGVSREIPRGCTIKKIDAALLSRCRGRSYVIIGYGDERAFLTNGFGFCLLKANEIISEAYALSIGAGKAEVGVVTAERYRRRGYGHAACTRLIRACEEKGLGAYYSCNRENIASVRLARALGFRGEKPYQIIFYTCSRHKENEFVVRATNAPPRSA